MKVNVTDFIARYCGGGAMRHGLFVPEDILCECRALELQAMMTDTPQYIEVPDNIDSIIEVARQKEEQREARYHDVSALRLQGMKAEEDGDVATAIDRYAEAIELGEASDFDLLHAYRHAYNRIFVLLSRVKDYAREASYIERLLSHQLQDSDRQRLTDRLQKTKAKIR